MAKLPSTLNRTKHNWDKICQRNSVRSAEEPCGLTLKNLGTQLQTGLFYSSQWRRFTSQLLSEQQRAVWMYSSQGSWWLIKMRKLISLCDDAVGSGGYCIKYENNLIWLVNSPKIRTTKTTRTWLYFQESLNEFPIPVFPLSPLIKSSPTLGLVLEQESSLIPTFQSRITEITAKWKCQHNFFCLIFPNFCNSFIRKKEFCILLNACVHMQKRTKQ